MLIRDPTEFGTVASDRCARCRQRRELCLCCEIPTITTLTRVVMVMPADEFVKPSNTGRLGMLALPNSEIRIHGVRHTPLDYDALTPAGTPALLLFPTPHARPLTREFARSLSPPTQLIVPDGTWRQALELAQRIIARCKVVTVKLDSVDQTFYTLRRRKRSDGVCTLEAIGYALSQLENVPGIATDLCSLVSTLVERTEQSRGARRRGRLFTIP